MTKVTLRKVGGSVMVAIPPAILDFLNVKAGEALEIKIDGKKVVLEPAPKKIVPKKYSLEKLIAEHLEIKDQLPKGETDLLKSPPLGKEVL